MMTTATNNGANSRHPRPTARPAGLGSIEAAWQAGRSAMTIWFYFGLPEVFNVDHQAVQNFGAIVTGFTVIGEK
jgi:hypothetical protein